MTWCDEMGILIVEVAVAYLPTYLDSFRVKYENLKCSSEFGS